MSIITDFFAGGTEGILKGVKDVVGAFKADPLELAKLNQAIAQAEMTLMLGLSQAQTKVNEIEAASQDKFTSRWRPAIGWICGAALAYTYIFQPFLIFAFISIGEPISAEQLPNIPVGELSVILMGMLGLAGLRTLEKVQGKP